MDVLLIGAGGTGGVALDIVEKAGSHRIIGVADKSRPVGSMFSRYPVVGLDTDVPRLHAEMGFEGVLVAIGDNWIRSRIVANIESKLPEVKFPAAIHPSVVLAEDVKIGRGTIIFGGAVLNSGAMVGRHCLICTQASIDHDSVVGDFTIVSAAAAHGGGARLGRFSFLGMGAVISHGVTVGDHTVVGAGAAVVGDLDDRVVAVGVPARPIRSREIGETFL